TALAVVAVIALSRNRLTALVHATAAAGASAIAIAAASDAPQIANGSGTNGAGGVLAAALLAVLLAAAAAILTSLTPADRTRIPPTAAHLAAAAGAVTLVLFGAAFGPG